MFRQLTAQKSLIVYPVPVVWITELKGEIGRIEGTAVSHLRIDGTVDATDFRRALRVQTRTPADDHVFRFVL